MTENEKIAAFVWAAAVNPAAIPLFALKKGEQFQWPNGGGPVMTYCGRGWYSMPGVSRKFRSRGKTAVMEVKKAPIVEPTS